MDAKVIVWDKKWKNMAKKVKKTFHFFILGLQIWEYDILYVQDFSFLIFHSSL